MPKAIEACGLLETRCSSAASKSLCGSAESRRTKGMVGVYCTLAPAKAPALTFVVQQARQEAWIGCR